MTFVYIVRCNFTEPEKEQAWNAWYSGPKIAQMLAKPYFRTCQRFRLTSGIGRNYLALWTVQSPQAFHTPEYKSDWGFFEWHSYICDWSRDLFDAGATPESAFAVTPAGALHVVAFDTMRADEASAARRGIAPAQPHLIWLSVAGLDRHSPIVGLAPLSDLPLARSSLRVRDLGVQEAIYRPICELYTTASNSEGPLPYA